MPTPNGLRCHLCECRDYSAAHPVPLPGNADMLRDLASIGVTGAAEKLSEYAGKTSVRARQRSEGAATMVGQHVVHRKISPCMKPGGGWGKESEDRDVVLLAISDEWAMVRRPKCAPYVCYASELLPPNMGEGGPGFTAKAREIVNSPGYDE